MINLLLSKYKAYAYATVIAVICTTCFGAGIGFNKLTSDRKIAQLKLEHQSQIDDREQTLMEIERQANAEIARQQKVINEAAKNANEQIKELAVNLDNSASIADRLRAELKKALLDGSACKPTSKPSSGGEEASNLFADLYSRCDEESGAIAKYADEVTIAHQACLSSR